MKLLNILKKVVGFDQQGQATKDMSTIHTDCMVKIKLTKTEFANLCRYYYQGQTSYKSIFRNVFGGTAKKTVQIMKDANEKAENGCYIDHTFVTFFVDEKNDKMVVQIPFDVYSDKRNLPPEIRNAKSWHRGNSLRILKLYPEFANYDGSSTKDIEE